MGMATEASGLEPYGRYGMTESARYLRAAPVGDQVYSVNSATLMRWIQRGVTSLGLVGRPGGGLLIEFEDLISMRVVAALRAAGVKWREIDDTALWLRDYCGHAYPFATEYLWTGQGELFVEWTAQLVSGSRHGQAALGLLQDYLIPVADLVFNRETHTAESWEPMPRITLQSRVQFGVPCIKGTRIPTKSVVSMIEAGDAPDWVGKAYGITDSDVRAACAWESRLAAA